jgi:hypothetical protein
MTKTKVWLFYVIQFSFWGETASQITSRPSSIIPEPLLSSSSSFLSSPHLSCCQYLNPTQSHDLVQCINSSITNYDLPQLSSLIPYRENKLGPKLFITLLTRMTPNIYDYGSYAYFLQAIYATYHGYLLLPLYEDSAADDYQLYRKLIPIQEALAGISSGCDYIVWMDAGTPSPLFLLPPDIFE